MSNVESSRAREEDEESELSESQSISSEVAFGRHRAEANEDEKAKLSGDEAESDHGFGDEFDEDFEAAWQSVQPQPTVATDEEGEDQTPEVTPEQQAQIDARPRMVLRRAGAPQNPGPSSATPILTPEPTAKQPMDKGKGKEEELLFDDALTLNAEEIEGIHNLNSKQMRHLIETFRLEITAEARPAIKQELRGDLEEEIQSDFDEKLAAEKARWAEEKRGINEKARAAERKSRESFAQGMERGESTAIAAHAARWTSMENQLSDKTKQLQTKEDQLNQEQVRLEGLARDHTNALDAEVADNAHKIATQAQEIDRLTREGNACLAAWNQQLSEKDEEIDRVRAEAVSCARSLQQQLEAQSQDTSRLRDQLISEQLISEQLTQQRATLAQTLTRTRHRQSAALTDNSLSELTETLSKLRLRPKASVPTPKAPSPIPANSTAGQQTQPRADDCAARLQDLRARLEQRRARELKQQAAGMRMAFWKKVRVYRANRDAELTMAKAQGLEENRRLGEVISSLGREKEASDAKLERIEKASQEANRTIQSLEEREKEANSARERASDASRAALEREAKASQAANREIQSLRDWSGELSVEKMRALASLELKEKDCRRGKEERRSLKSRLDQMEWSVDVATGRVEELEGAKEAADAEVRSLKRANQGLDARKRELETRSSSAIADLNSANAKLDRCQMQSRHLAAQLGVLGGRLVECETTMKEEADKVRALKGIVEEIASGRLEAWAKWEKAVGEAAVAPPITGAEMGEREMDAPLGATEKANEGLLRPQFPRWKEFALWLLVALLGLVVAAFWAASAAKRERQLWMAGDEATRRAVISLHAGGVPESWRGGVMFGVWGGVFFCCFLLFFSFVFFFCLFVR